METSNNGHLTEEISPLDFKETLLRLEHAIADAGLKLFARIDHAGGAREFGLEMPSTIVLIYGQPTGGTPLMLAYPDAALDLPLKLLVRVRADEKTSVLFRPIGAALASAGVPVDQASKLAPAQNLIAAALRDHPAD